MFDKLIALDIDRNNEFDTGIEINQANRNSIKFVIKVEKDGKEIDYSQFDSVRLVFQNQARRNIEDDGELTSFGVEYVLRDIIFAVHGLVRAYVVFVKDNMEVATLIFRFKIATDLINIPQADQTYIRRLNELVKEAESMLASMDLSFLDVAVSSRASDEDMRSVLSKLFTMGLDMSSIKSLIGASNPTTGGTGKLFDYFKKIDTLIGIASPTTANTANLFNYLKKLETAISGITGGGGTGGTTDLTPVLTQVDVQTSTRASSTDMATANANINTANTSLTTVKADLVAIKNYVDTVETTVNTINNNTDTIETNIGTPNPSVGGTDKLFNYLKKLEDKITALENKSGGTQFKIFRASGNATLNQVLLNVAQSGVLKKVIVLANGGNFQLSVTNAYGTQNVSLYQDSTWQVGVQFDFTTLQLVGGSLQYVSEYAKMTSLDYPFTSFTLTATAANTNMKAIVLYDL